MIMWALKYKESGEFDAEFYKTRSDARFVKASFSEGDMWTVVKVEVKEVK